jgi:hypothetical protein
MNGRFYTVLERTKEISHDCINGSSTLLLGSVDYITSCGIDLNKLDDDFNSFELIQVDGVITKVQE